MNYVTAIFGGIITALPMFIPILSGDEKAIAVGILGALTGILHLIQPAAVVKVARKLHLAMLALVLLGGIMGCGMSVAAIGGLIGGIATAIGAGAAIFVQTLPTPTATPTATATPSPVASPASSIVASPVVSATPVASPSAS